MAHKHKKLQKGFISLTPVEVEVFLEMKAESQRIQIGRAQLQAQEQTLIKRHVKIVAALAKTHRLDCRIKVMVNQKGTGLNYEEVKDDGAEGDAAGPSPEA